MQRKVMLILKNVDMHQQCLAASGGVPKGDLPQIGQFIGRNLVLVEFIFVELGDELVEVGDHFVGITEESVEVNLGKQ